MRKSIICAVFLLPFFISILSSAAVKVENRKEISQYGITWTFDKPVKSGQFITGDWWGYRTCDNSKDYTRTWYRCG